MHWPVFYRATWTLQKQTGSGDASIVLKEAIVWESETGRVILVLRARSDPPVALTLKRLGFCRQNNEFELLVQLFHRSHSIINICVSAALHPIEFISQNNQTAQPSFINTSSFTNDWQPATQHSTQLWHVAAGLCSLVLFRHRNFCLFILLFQSLFLCHVDDKWLECFTAVVVHSRLQKHQSSFICR